MKWLGTIVGICCIFGAVNYTHAQLNLPSDNIQLELSPRFPEPGDTVRVTLNDFIFDTTGSKVEWVIDGEPDPSVDNLRTITLQAGAVGVATELQAILTLRDGKRVVARSVLTPSKVTIILDADTLTPVWYKGRPEPSIGSNLQATIIPDDGTGADPQTYSYTWRLNNKVVGGGSTPGAYVRTLTMPTGNTATLAVDVSNSQGNIIGSKSILINNQEPELLFYEVNPLRGTSRLSLGDTTNLIGSEMSVRAEPFFMNKTILTQSPLLEWEVNGRTIENPNADKQVITLQNAGGSADFNISFHIRNLQQLLQGVEDSFNIVF